MILIIKNDFKIILIAMFEVFRTNFLIGIIIEYIKPIIIY